MTPLLALRPVRRVLLSLLLLGSGCTCSRGDVGAAASDAAAPAATTALDAGVPDLGAGVVAVESFIDSDVDNQVIHRLLYLGSGSGDLSAGGLEAAAVITPTNAKERAAAFEAELKAELQALDATVLPELPSRVVTPPSTQTAVDPPAPPPPPPGNAPVPAPAPGAAPVPVVPPAPVP